MQWPPGVLVPVCVSVWVSCVSGANAWQQEYIAIDTKSNTSERYTWDSDHQPRYEDILAERMKSSETPGGLALNQGLAPPDSSRGMSVGWNYLLANGMTSGPVASLRSDYTAPATKSVGETGYVNTLGWRMDYQSLWGVHPWAQVSYNQSLASDAWSPTPAPERAAGVMSPWAPICRWDRMWRHGPRCHRRTTSHRGKIRSI